MATLCGLRHLWVWDVESAKPIHKRDLEKVDYFNCHLMSFTPDGESIVFVSSDNDLCVWQLETQDVRKILPNVGNKPLAGISGPRWVEFSPDGKTLALSGDAFSR